MFRSLALLLMTAFLAACGAAGPQDGAPGDPMKVVATTTVFADMVKNVGGDLIDVTSLVPKNGEVHTFEPKPDDVKKVSQAKLLVMNGLGLDDWVEKDITNASASGTPLIKLAEDLPGIELFPGEDPGKKNPHLWMDVKYAELYVDRIAAGLKKVDPSHAGQYDTQASAYKKRLDLLNADVGAKIATIPQENRKLVTFHDAFPYYAREYGITIVGVAVEAPGQEPSAAETAALIDAIKKSHVKAIFSEDQFPTKLIDQLGQETGTKVESDLYDGSLGDPPVTSYEALITWDTDKLVKALK